MLLGGSCFRTAKMSIADQNLNSAVSGASFAGVTGNRTPETDASTKECRLVVDGVTIEIPFALYECLRFESQERGISIAQAYKEEIEATEYLKRHNISNEELDQVAIKVTGPND